MLKRYFKFNIAIIIFSVTLLTIIILGSFYVKYTWDKSIDKKSSEVLKIVQIAEIGLNGEMIKQVHGEEQDVGTVAYESVKRRLMNIKKTDADISFTYLYIKKGDKLYFLADSEPVDSEDYSPPGQEYTEAPAEYFKPFLDGKSLITQPVTDRWGTWISVLAPMKDFESNEIIAVFGIDYPVNAWSDDAMYNSMRSGTLSLGLILILITLFIIYNKSLKKRENDKKYKYLFDGSSDAIMAINPPDWKYSNANSATLKMFGVDNIEEIKKLTPGDLSPEQQPDGRLSKEKAKEMIDIAMDKGSNNFEWVHKKLNGPEFLTRVSLSRIEDFRNAYLQVILRDITKEKEVVKQIEESEKELKKALDETGRINKLMVGRELEMIQLKKELSELKNQKK